jgi:protein with PEP-CTERM/exosortase system signal
MVMNLRKINSCTAALAVAFLLVTFSHVSALSIGDTRDLGLIDKNQPANPTASAGFINILLDQPLSSGPTTIGANKYTRTGNDPLGGNYPDAVYSGVEFGTGVTNINLGSGYLYLLAKYDGPNYGSVVWYVGGLTGAITIPGFPVTNPNQFGVSHTFLYNPTPTGVPDGGTTLMLLGIGLSGLAVTRRLFRFA